MSSLSTTDITVIHEARVIWRTWYHHLLHRSFTASTPSERQTLRPKKTALPLPYQFFCVTTILLSTAPTSTQDACYTWLLRRIIWRVESRDRSHAFFYRPQQIMDLRTTCRQSYGHHTSVSLQFQCLYLQDMSQTRSKHTQQVRGVCPPCAFAFFHFHFCFSPSLSLFPTLLLSRPFKGDKGKPRHRIHWSLSKVNSVRTDMVGGSRTAAATQKHVNPCETRTQGSMSSLHGRLNMPSVWLLTFSYLTSQSCTTWYPQTV